MPKLGDLLFDALRNVEGVRLDFLHQLRLEGNRAWSAAMIAETWGDRAGNLDPSLFDRHGPPGGFSLLGHEAASLWLGTGQTIGDGTWTTAEFGDVTRERYAYGMALGSDNKKIILSGMANKLVLFCGKISFAANATGFRGVRLKGADGSLEHVAELPAVDGGTTELSFASVQNITVDQTSFTLEVYQNSGGNLDIGNGRVNHWTAIRLR